MAEKAMSDPMAMAGKLEFWWITRLRSKVFSLESLQIWVRVWFGEFIVTKPNKKFRSTQKFYQQD